MFLDFSLNLFTWIKKLFKVNECGFIHEFVNVIILVKCNEIEVKCVFITINAVLCLMYLLQLVPMKILILYHTFTLFFVNFLFP